MYGGLQRMPDELKQQSMKNFFDAALQQLLHKVESAEILPVFDICTEASVIKKLEWWNKNTNCHAQ